MRAQDAAEERLDDHRTLALDALVGHAAEAAARNRRSKSRSRSTIKPTSRAQGEWAPVIQILARSHAIRCFALGNPAQQPQKASARTSEKAAEGTFESTMTTLRHQGGPMSEEECLEVEKDPRWP